MITLWAVILYKRNHDRKRMPWNTLSTEKDIIDTHALQECSYKEMKSKVCFSVTSSKNPFATSYCLLISPFTSLCLHCLASIYRYMPFPFSNIKMRNNNWNRIFTSSWICWPVRYNWFLTGDYILLFMFNSGHDYSR